MTERVLVLLAAVAAGLVLFALYAWYRRRPSAAPERLDVADLGLELMTGCCAFVVFTSPSCRPCKAALQLVASEADRTDGLAEVTSVDATERPDVALRCNVRTIPTTFLITASGHVIERWIDVPERADVRASLGRV